MENPTLKNAKRDEMKVTKMILSSNKNKRFKKAYSTKIDFQKSQKVITAVLKMRK